MSWADDPELIATFRAEVAERLESLRTGLLAAGEFEPSRELLDRLFRDAHTIKGSARMLGLDAVVSVAHRCEDVLGALRDGRIRLDARLLDLLLAAADGIECRLPGPGAVEDAPDELLEALAAARDGRPDAEPEPSPTHVVAVPVQPLEAPPAAVDPNRAVDVVRVPAKRLHLLVDAVGEAEQRARHLIGATAALASELANCRQDYAGAPTAGDELGDRLEQLERAATALRLDAADAAERLENVRGGAMSLAMVPLRRVTAGFGPLVRDVARRGGKEVDLVVVGADVELDARVLDGIAAALRHLVTNAVDHGCERPERRRAAGKSARATVEVRARAAGSTVVVEVADDGAGIDAGLPADSGSELLELLCRPGFTTRNSVTETSGRGVGLDVVRSAVDDLGGSLTLENSVGTGTRFVMTLPVTLGVMRCLLTRVGGQEYAIPVTNLVESIDLETAVSHDVAGRPFLAARGELIPLHGLAAALGLSPGDERTAVVVRRSGDRGMVAWAVDEVVEERELVVKELGPFLGRRRLHPGASIDQQGRVVLLLDPREIAAAAASAPVLAVAGNDIAPVDRVPAEAPVGGHVLLVEDSVGVRELQRSILEHAGYDVSVAVDGTDGASRLAGPPVDLVVSDVEMPGMDGFNLTRAIRRTPGWEQVPVVIMTSRGEDADKRAGLEAGADAYLLKATFDSAELISTVRRLIGG